MSLSVLGIGTAVPTTTLSMDEGRELARYLCAQNDAHVSWLPSMYSNTGIRQRHLFFQRSLVDRVIGGDRQPRYSPTGKVLADEGTHDIFVPTGPGDRGPTTAERMRIYRDGASQLAIPAAAAALEQSACAAAAITHLITVSCTGFFAPGIDSVLIDALGLDACVQRTHVGYMGCHGAINGLRVAQAFTGADPSARVLLCAVELCGLHYHYGWDPQQIVANALFGDGAAALVGAASVAASGEVWRVRATGSCRLPNSADAMTWNIGDHGFEMTLARSVPTLIARHLRPWLTAWLEKHGVALADIATWAVHPGGPHILTAVEECLCLPPDALAISREIFAEYGNMSSPTVLFILDRLRERRAKGPCVALGFGPGLVAEAALLE